MELYFSDKVKSRLQMVGYTVFNVNKQNQAKHSICINGAAAHDKGIKSIILGSDFVAHYGSTQTYYNTKGKDNMTARQDHSLLKRADDYSASCVWGCTGDQISFIDNKKFTASEWLQVLCFILPPTFQSTIKGFESSMIESIPDNVTF